MDPSHAFESLAGIRPGDSEIADVISRLGWREPSEMSGGGLFYSFDDEGIQVGAASAQYGSANATVSEVRLCPPNASRLPCGVYLGQPQAEALDAVRRCHQVTNEYDDAIYFRPSERLDLLACVEFLDAGEVVGVELFEDEPICDL